MKRKTIFLILTAACLFFSSVNAHAQRVTGQIGLSFQNRFKAEQSETGLTLWGVHAGAQFEPFYPWPIYLETGLGAVMVVAKDGAHNYFLELPLDLTWQWEPGPYFSMGPYVGAYGKYSLWKSYIYDGITNPNKLNWGLMGGISIRPGKFLINVGYYRDMMPFNKDAVEPNAFRFSNGIRLLVGVCF